MERTIVTPQSTDLHLSIPQKYVGKRVEVIFFDVDEATSNVNAKIGIEASFVLDEKKKAILEHRSNADRSRFISEEELFKNLDEL